MTPAAHALAVRRRMIAAQRALTDAPPIDGARDVSRIDPETYRAVRAFAEGRQKDEH
jgi:hypothetical protein